MPDQARGQCGGQLVGIVLAVGAGEARIAEQLAPAEGEGAGVEQRQVALVAVRRVQVEQARLQCMQVGIAVYRGFAVEEQAHVQTGDGQAAARRGVAAQLFRSGGGRVDAGSKQLLAAQAVGQPALQFVGGVAPSQGRGDEPRGTGQRH